MNKGRSCSTPSRDRQTRGALLFALPWLVANVHTAEKATVTGLLEERRLVLGGGWAVGRGVGGSTMGRLGVWAVVACSRAHSGLDCCCPERGQGWWNSAASEAACTRVRRVKKQKSRVSARRSDLMRNEQKHARRVGYLPLLHWLLLLRVALCLSERSTRRCLYRHLSGRCRRRMGVCLSLPEEGHSSSPVA